MLHVKLQGSDGEAVNVDVQVAKSCGFIKNILQDLGTHMDEGEVLDLPTIKSDTLQKVIEWAAFHKDDPPPLERVVGDWDIVQPLDDLSPWDQEFLDMDKSELFELLMAGYHLELPSLVEAICKTVANMIKDMTPAEIRATFSIVNDFPDHQGNPPLTEESEDGSES